MADFCLKCFNSIHGTEYKKADVVQEYGICEECGKHTDVVVDLRGYGLFSLIARLYITLFNRGE